MVHENDPTRGGCAFGLFFDGRTPDEVLKPLLGSGNEQLRGGIYDDLALALYSGAYWPVSVALVAKALATTGTAAWSQWRLGSTLSGHAPPNSPISLRLTMQAPWASAATAAS